PAAPSNRVRDVRAAAHGSGRAATGDAGARSRFAARGGAIREVSARARRLLSAHAASHERRSSMTRATPTFPLASDAAHSRAGGKGGAHEDGRQLPRRGAPRRIASAWLRTGGRQDAAGPPGEIYRCAE